MPRGWAPSRPTTIYKLLKQIELLALSLDNSRGHRTLKQEAPDAQPLRPVLQKQPRVSSLNYTRWTPTALKLAPDASGEHRSHAQRGLQTRGITGRAPEHPVPYPKNIANAQGHRTRTTGRTLSVRCSQSETPKEVRQHRTHQQGLTYVRCLASGAEP